MPAIPARNARKYRGKKLGGPEDLHTAWRVLAGGAADAARSLVDIAENCPVPGARVRAAQLVLEMTGFRAADTIQVLPPEHDQAALTADGDSSAARIQARLDALTSPAPEPSAVPSLDDLAPVIVVDADVIDGQP